MKCLECKNKIKPKPKKHQGGMKKIYCSKKCEQKKWHREYAQRTRDLVKAIYQKRRLRVLIQYSDNPPYCKCCGLNIKEFLTIDHIIPVMGIVKYKDRSKGESRYSWGDKLWRWMEKNNYPKGFQVLCMNCNFAKRWYSICPCKRMSQRT